ncbi:MAG: heavy metal translocating P-type ATPase [Lachnospiraceae bacterium]|nr:heavy metal translocating P-type ATPase [Lachnospiraceae bacterium]
MDFIVKGMSCAACSARVEKAVSSLDGVSDVTVSLLTNSMKVDGTVTPDSVIAAVEKAGYQAFVSSGKRASSYVNQTESEAVLKDTETKMLRNRLISSLILLIPLMYISMGHGMFGFPLPEVLADNTLANAITQMLVAAMVMVINKQFFVNGVKGLLHRAPNMDTLVSLGSFAAFGYSVFVLYRMTVLAWNGEQAEAVLLGHDLYFEAAAMILTLITVGKMLEARSKGRTTDAIRGLMQLAPKMALVRKGDEWVEIPVEEVQIGDRFVVYAGDAVAVDGIVVQGHATIDESALTGESIPVEKKEGETVFQATTSCTGYIECEAVRVGEDTTLSQIIMTVKETAAGKAPIAKLADRVSGVFVPVVMGIAFVTMIVWLLCGESAGFAIARGISVLVISCPCALGLATPVAIMVGSGVGARSGILFKSAVSLEETGRVRILALDKTGTITRGEPQVTDVVPFDGVSEEKLLAYAYALESCSEHPLGAAIVQYASEKKIEKKDITEFETLPGNGIRGVCGGIALYGGSRSYIESLMKQKDAWKEKADAYAMQGKTPLFFADDAGMLGMIMVADVLKDDSVMAIKEAKANGYKTIMLTGDNALTAEAIAKEAGIDEVMADLLPQGKVLAIRDLKQKGKVAMVGDGINDAPALTEADVGIAIGTGADIAIDAADVVLMNNRLTDAVNAVNIGHKTLAVIKGNLFWAFFYNCIGIPIAAGVLAEPFGITLNPMLAAAAMSLSSFCVVTNALRLNLMIKDKRQSKPYKEEKIMTKTMEIKGMMCTHCSGRVKSVLEELEQVASAEVSHETGLAQITLKEDISDDVLKETVIKQGYEVVSIK